MALRLDKLTETPWLNHEVTKKFSSNSARGGIIYCYLCLFLWVSLSKHSSQPTTVQPEPHPHHNLWVLPAVKTHEISKSHPTLRVGEKPRVRLVGPLAFDHSNGNGACGRIPTFSNYMRTYVELQGLYGPLFLAPCRDLGEPLVPPTLIYLNIYQNKLFACSL